MWIRSLSISAVCCDGRDYYRREHWATATRRRESACFDREAEIKGHELTREVPKRLKKTDMHYRETSKEENLSGEVEVGVEMDLWEYRR